MAPRIGTALQRRTEPEAAASGRARGALGLRVAEAVERRSGRARDGARVGVLSPVGERLKAAVERRSEGTRGRARTGALSPVGERLMAAVERRLVRAVEQRLGGGPDDRRPGRLEQRLVAALDRRASAGRDPAPDRVRPPAWVGRAVARRGGAGALARRETTLRELVLSLVARGLVRALAVFMRLLGRGLVSAPIRRLLRVLARRAIRARPTQKAGILAFLLGAIALGVQIVRRRLAAMPAGQRAAIGLGLRLLRTILTRGWPLLKRLVRALAALARRGLERS